MTHRTRTARSTAALGAVLLLALAACSAEETPAPAASSTAPVSSTASSAVAATAASSAFSPVSDSASASSAAPSASASSVPAVTSAEPLAAECNAAALPTKTKGTLTIATDNPVYEPWFVDNKPESGKGFEGAVARAVAGRLGFEPGSLKWIRVPFDNVIKPGDLDFDFDINEFSITPDRKKAVDFSSGYYDVTQAIIALNANKAAGAGSVSDLAGAKIGAQIGTTSLRAINDIVKPTQAAAVFNTNDDGVKALQNRQIDALVVDLPTALYMTSAQIDNSKIIGQFAGTGGEPEQFGLVLQKGSPLTSCVSQAVDALRADGTLTKLQDEWLTVGAGAPVLK